MANITKRTAKRLAGALEPGETVQIAVLCEPRGSYGLGSVALTVLPRTGDRYLSKKAAESRDGTASLLPSSAFVVAVTSDDRVVFAASDGLRFAAPNLILHIGDVFVTELRSRGLGRGATLVFADGSATDVDLQRGQPIDLLVGRLGGLVPPPL